MAGLRKEATGRDTQRVSGERFCPQDLVLPAEQRKLLLHWLKKESPSVRWQTLLTASVSLLKQPGVESAEALAEALAHCGLAVLVQKRENGVWRNQLLTWVDYQALCGHLNLNTLAARRTAFAAQWEAARELPWQSAALAQAWQGLERAAPDIAAKRLQVLQALNTWLTEGKSGSRREFSLFSFGRTKHELSSADWAWLDSEIGLHACGIHQHSSGLWLAGELKLSFHGRVLDVGAARGAMAILESLPAQASAAQGGFTHIRVVENRTSFENLAQDFDADRLLIWLPGYASNRWLAAVDHLLALCPRPLQISCDADPDGVQIALRAARLWSARGLAWEPQAMDAATASTSLHKLKMSDRDRALAERLLQAPDLHPVLADLLRWCLETGHKAEQENWLV